MSWTWEDTKALGADVTGWAWGTVQGAFNEKSTLSQIIVDAVIGMIPLVGDVTAVRDLLAVSIGMADSEEKRNSTWQWVLLVVLLFALIPVFGGVVKGVGRILVKVAQEAAHLAPAARAAHLLAGAREVVEFLNRIGVKNAEKWLLKLRISDHALVLQEKFAHLMVTLQLILRKAGKKVEGVAPNLATRIQSLIHGLERVAEAGQARMPPAIKALDEMLRDVQRYIRSGGETTSRVTRHEAVALHEAAIGQRIASVADERRLVEEGLLPVRSSRGGYKQNPMRIQNAIKKFYKHEPDYPDMLARPDTQGRHANIAAYAGKMINRQLKHDEEVFRFFGPPRTTHGVVVDEAWASGAWWGLGKPPTTAKEWREYAAVLDSFNGDGFYVTARVSGSKGPKAVVGTVSEQFGEKIPGQYLPGGATQAFFFLDKDFGKTLSDMGHEFISTGGTKKLVDPVSGLEITFHKTGWTDANGVWGYLRAPGLGTVQTARVGTREMATKQNNEVAIHP
jgi:hypothetical protein